MQSRQVQTIGLSGQGSEVVDTHAQADGPITLRQMNLSTLVQRSLTESNRFYTGRSTDTRFAYELFRRALVERNEIAWQYIYNQYGPLVESWVRRCGAFPKSGESSEFFVISAFTRFWKAVTAERFHSFDNLAGLLSYLQMCASCVVIDSVRTQSWAEVLPEPMLRAASTSQTAPDEEAVERVNREDFWKYIDTQLNDEAERVVVYQSFVVGMKPTAIQQHRPDLFGTVKDVYNVKRNVLDRLSRNQELRQMLDWPHQTEVTPKKRYDRQKRVPSA
ncbi:MAG: sigma-70 family RNA polymerase sigma factor [Chloroflexi bacterium AL-W]|nr:sigma-70 family RNA polymerase sigma factor [Chloroflexi bacterium AL-N1]NOK70775.1 sigma-70 family RNA polymerase sigma factor [Chloroflexi bacterium AL-N10]NOK78335.1 sigma-70 family RNA polymerase sigma factor [Chloroflexi bacterium AL-N5]NOK85678.1 sigma-70 family RNA polymerase sigma factor [Chloroflexi bacterium AL-W]NOK92592.1 sigma-70 family RNA polymerase sigma factor [Chloroflexi bacterium AL-N15]